MSLPIGLKSVIKEEYGNYGWESACCFSFLAEYLGYKVLDESDVITALKMIATEKGTSLKNYENTPIPFLGYDVGTNYGKVHIVFTQNAKTIKHSNEDSELDRKSKVIEEFIQHIMQGDPNFLKINFFYREYVKNTVKDSLKMRIKNLFKLQEKHINEKADKRSNYNKSKE